MPELQWVYTYRHHYDYVESLGGVSWSDAPLPPWLHLCTPQTRSRIGGGYAERCRCGAARQDPECRWAGRNQRRRARRGERRSPGAAPAHARRRGGM